jgi:heme iron utilization protein
MHASELQAVAELIRGRRWAALGTLRAGAPFVSWVAYVPEAEFGGFLMHLSRLSPHTGQLLADGRASLAISVGEDGVDDPQTLARITLQGQADVIPAEAESFGAAKARYLERFPTAEMLFGFPDFVLFRFVPTEARFIGGFGRIFTLTTEQLKGASRAG